MDKNFTEKQREIVARRMGYDGPMNMFDTYLKSNPADEQKYIAIGQKLMARGGMVKKNKVHKMADGGTVTTTSNTTLAPTTSRSEVEQNYADLFKRTADAEGLDYWQKSGLTGDALTNAMKDAAAAADRSTMDRALVTEQIKEEYQPGSINTGAGSYTAAQIQATPDQFINTELAPEYAATAAPSEAGVAKTAEVQEAKPAATYQATTTTPAVAEALTGVKAVTGEVKPEALVTAEQMAPETTAVKDLQAAQGVATQVTGAPTRTVQEGEMVTGTAVDQARVQAALAANVAEQGTVTAEMTIQGQLDKLLTDFDAGNPPAWAASSLRNATAQLAARGLGASSLAGQAIIQATLEAATPIAAADAKVFEQMGLTNLSNRQQMAVLTAQQRATFLGQEFDQEFQTRVVNAARVADIANQNFNAQTQIALENARLTQSMDLANLSNKQALVMAEAAQIATLEVTNLNNRQQAAVENAKAFLQMDLTNLVNEQQTEMFKAQSIVQSLMTDAAAENAAKQFNATSENQTNQFFADLKFRAQSFNSTQANAMEQFNIDQANAIAKFNADAQNQRDQFNASQRVIIDQSNAQWRREIATANTAAINRANEVSANNATQLTITEYNNKAQEYRDQLEYAWKTAEAEIDRANKIVVAEIDANAKVIAATVAKNGDIAKTIGNAAATVLSNTGVLSDLWSGAKDIWKDWTSGSDSETTTSGSTDTSWDDVWNDGGA